jgi:hypothetical protein
VTVRYQGSPYHKTRPSKWGQPVRPSSKTPCPTDIPDDEVVVVLERDIAQAIERGHCSERPARGWPRYVWGRSEFRRTAAGRSEADRFEVVWEARATGEANGSYKAYPVQRGRHASEMPSAVEEFLWP